MRAVAKESTMTGVGVDIIELRRFRSVRFPARIAELVLTPREYARYESHTDALAYLASRFALKEAVIKAFPKELTYRDIEITKEGKKPRVKLFGKQTSTDNILVSLAHSTDYVAGFAICAK
ncbi:MAG: holo-ACP synthase [bacterium]|nr:holo-ACP synthase [bacterium]